MNKKKYFDKSYREILTEACSDSPTPGGGSVSALVACLGNGMLSMVCNLTKNKEKYIDFQEEIQIVLKESNIIMKELENLVVDDMNVFNIFMKTLKMPKETESEKKIRLEAIQKAYISATEVPLKIAETCLKIIELSSKVSYYGNKTAISDIGVGAYIAEAAMLSALLSVDINLKGIKDNDFVNKIIMKKVLLINKAKEAREKTIVIVKDRIQK